MSVCLKNRSLLSLVHHTPEEVDHLVRLAVELKEAKRLGPERQCLQGKNIALIFEKPSTRTRAAFEVAAHDQGAHTTLFDPQTSHFGLKESVRDSARVLGRMFDAIEYRGASQKTVEELAAYAGVPVFNGLTDEWHPTQMLADLMTMREASGKPWRDIRFAYLGDARNNMGHSLLMAGAKMGMDVRISAPKSCLPRREVVDLALETAKTSGAKVTVTEDPLEAVKGCDFLHTDVWVSMGEPVDVWNERIRALLPYQVNAGLVAAAENPVHALPSRLSQRRDEGRPGDRRASSESRRRPRGDGRGLRVASLDRIRAGGKPHAHHQGPARGDACLRKRRGKGPSPLRPQIASASVHSWRMRNNFRGCVRTVDSRSVDRGSRAGFRNGPQSCREAPADSGR